MSSISTRLAQRLISTTREIILTSPPSSQRRFKDLVERNGFSADEKHHILVKPFDPEKDIVPFGDQIKPKSRPPKEPAKEPVQAPDIDKDATMDKGKTNVNPKEKPQDKPANEPAPAVKTTKKTATKAKPVKKTPATAKNSKTKTSGAGRQHYMR